MKIYAIIISLIATPLLTKAQSLEIDSLTNKYRLQGVALFDSLNKDMLYGKTMEWIALNYNSANDAIQYSDKGAGKIIIKGSFKTNLFMKEGWIKHTLVFEFKDGKMRYTYTDFSYFSAGSRTMEFESKSLGFKKKIFDETETDINTSIEGLKKYILTNSTQGNDW